jgi:hypothetical protein
LSDIGAYGLDDACAVAEWHAPVEHALARCVEDQEVAVVEACRLDSDADLAVGRFGLTDIGTQKASGTSMAIQMIGFHRCSFTRVFTWMSTVCKV